MAGVVYAHCVQSDAIGGHLGVQLFFTISGFLITGMLLDARGTGDRADASPLSHFFMRRILRLWPAYYLILGLAIWRNWEDVRASAPWHLLYGTNIYFYLYDTYDPWILDHFWSLAIEEQYYLLWPFIVYACGRGTLARLVPLLIFLSWIGLLISDPLGWNGQNISVDWLLPFSLACLGAGGLLALWHRASHPILAFLPKIGCLGAIIWVALLAVRGNSIWLVPLEALSWMTLVHLAAKGIGGPIGGVLSSRPIRYCGMISYGIYLYHNFILYGLGAGWLMGWQLQQGLTMLILNSVLSIIAASLSWHFLELPLNRLKRYLPFP